MKMFQQVPGDFQIFIVIIDLIQHIPISEDFLLFMCKRFRLFIDKFFDSFRCCNDSFNRIAALYGIDHGSMLQFLKQMKIIHLSDFTFSSQVIDNTGNFKQICRKVVCKELIIKTMHYCPSHQNLLHHILLE